MAQISVRRPWGNRPCDNIWLIKLSEAPKCVRDRQLLPVNYLSTGDLSNSGQRRALCFSKALELISKESGRCKEQKILKIAAEIFPDLRWRVHYFQFGYIQRKFLGDPGVCPHRHFSIGPQNACPRVGRHLHSHNCGRLHTSRWWNCALPHHRTVVSRGLLWPHLLLGNETSSQGWLGNLELVCMCHCWVPQPAALRSLGSFNLTKLIAKK